MSTPTAEEQIRFLSNMQRLLAEGEFVATYKYALLLALADIAVESGDDSGGMLQVPTSTVAKKYVEYYWRQSIPYVPLGVSVGGGDLLRQNTGQQAAILRTLAEIRQTYGDSLARLKGDARAWGSLVRDVDRVVRVMPLWKLQTVGRAPLEFLYNNTGEGKSITLKPGVAFCLRRFYGLISDLVRGAWVRYVRRHNHELLGTAIDLQEFLFGTERCELSTVKPVLLDLQRGKCFYCPRPLRTEMAHVDHFIPWSRYPVDLGHNFVLAHDSCNERKSDHLASAEHLETWLGRNEEHGMALGNQFDQTNVLHDIGATLRIADWAYTQTFNSHGLTWCRERTMVELKTGWEQSLRRLMQTQN